MGQTGSGTGIRRDFVLDAGALIGIERGDWRLRAILRRSLAPRSQLVIPATAIAQAWRGGPRSAPLARLIGKSEIDLLDEARAKQAGERIGSRGTSDVTDAHVVCCAVERQAALVTSDPADLEALTKPGESLRLIAI